ncbi:NAD(P)-dependent oxidoreductase [Arthrobacter alpinus]|uniref:NAD-dependent epimerase/dehydratase family protein n=1 Tax=Arthrobacter alpinus TaxID=656366 RepID=UPI001646DAE6|nr:NAD-dependent epimerase/dehydratase family protein [Arthrobacter alpinus]
MKVLVTGGVGFIGSHVVAAAVARGWDVRALDSLAKDLHPRRPTVESGVELMVGDVCDPDVVARALDGVSVVLHQSAKVGMGLDFSDAPAYVHNNDFATAVLLAGMVRAGAGRLVLASSMVVYGEGAYRGRNGELVRPGPRRREDLEAGIFDSRDPETGELLVPDMVTEDAVLDPRNVYAASKVAQEHLVSAWANTTGGRAIALRYHNVYGPGMPKDTPYAGVASFFRSALYRGEPPQVFEDGLQRRSFIHVGDVAEANIVAAQALYAGIHEPFRAYNVGADQVHTVGEVARTMCAINGGPEPRITGEYRLGDVRHVTASSARIKAELGWVPRRGFVDGMAEFMAKPLRGD